MRRFSCGTRKIDARIPGKGYSNSHGTRPVHLIITMIKWIRTSRLSIKNSLSLWSQAVHLLARRGSSLRIRVASDTESGPDLAPRVVSDTGSGHDFAETVRFHSLMLCVLDYPLQGGAVSYERGTPVSPTSGREDVGRTCAFEDGPAAGAASSLLLASLELSDTKVYEP